MPSGPVLTAVRRAITEHELLPDGAAVLVGVSGGVDSMALAHLLHALGYAVHVAHVNHRLRGAASEADAALVARYCKKKTWPYWELSVDQPPGTHGSVQEQARGQRYRFLQATAVEEGCVAVAVAQHADDQAETVLLHLLRGTAVHGLAGMPWSRMLGGGLPLIRPLLHVRKDELVQYATAHGIPWREDASNQQATYRRNRVRTALLPALEAETEGPVVPHLVRTADYVRAYLDTTWAPLQAALWAGCAAAEGPQPALRLPTLRALPAVWQTRLVLDALQAWLPAAPRTQASAEAVQALLDAQPGRRVAWGERGTVWRGRQRLWFVRAVPSMTAPVRLAVPGATAFWGGHVLVEEVAALPEAMPRCGTGYLYAPVERLTGRAVLQAWEPGDRIHAFGGGHHKVSDLLTEAHVPVYARAAVPVLRDGDDVLWVPGVRASEALRVAPAEGPVWRVTLVPNDAWPLR